MQNSVETALAPAERMYCIYLCVTMRPLPLIYKRGVIVMLASQGDEAREQA
jgi:hypothetical protein